jgi:hypothetical protein
MWRTPNSGFRKSVSQDLGRQNRGSALPGTSWKQYLTGWKLAFGAFKQAVVQKIGLVIYFAWRDLM